MTTKTRSPTAFLLSMLMLANIGWATKVDTILSVNHKQRNRGKLSLKACRWLIPNCTNCLDATWCNRCDDGYLALESFYGMECVPECPAGYYGDVLDSLRRVCVKTIECKTIYNCAECSERYLARESYKCDRCQAGYYLFAAELRGKTLCLEECPEGYKQHDRRCKKVGCADFFCTTCEDGWTLQFLGDSQDFTTCVRQCPEGYFKKVGHVKEGAICDKCKLHCRRCRDSLKCDECEEGYVLLNKEIATRCVENCPPDYRLVKKSSHNPAFCVLDREGCLDDRCQKCKEGFFHIRNHGISQCHEDCPEGYFKKVFYDVRLMEQRQCSKCIHKCQRCTDKKDCQVCESGYKKLAEVHEKYTHCLGSCPVGYDTIEDEKGHETCINPHEPQNP